MAANPVGGQQLHPTRRPCGLFRVRCAGCATERILPNRGPVARSLRPLDVSAGTRSIEPTFRCEATVSRNRM